MNVAIIGAGVSGLCMAIKCHKRNINYTIYEMNDNVGGLWNSKNGIVNEYSNVQVVSPTFRFEDDYSKYSEYTNADELYGKICENFKKFDIEKNIRFRVKLNSFKSLDDNRVELSLEKLVDSDNVELIESDRFFTVIVDALYIRTGTLNKVRELKLSNEEKFSGIIGYGTNDGKKEIDFTDKVVTVIGFGATAVENINNALQKGAKKVVVLARSLRNIWTRKMLYQIVKELIYPQHYLANYFRKDSWKRVNDIYNKSFDHFNNETINKIREVSTKMINDEMNHDMSKIPAVTEDILIYCYYGLLEIYHDEIEDINGTEITTKNGIKYNSDIIFKCTGYELVETFFKGHTIDNTIFVDGKHNITHNCALDRSGKVEFIHGPSKEVNILPLVSYPMVNHVFDELALYFLNFPNRFDVFRSNNKYDDIISNKNIENIEFRCYVHMFWKLIDYLKFSPLDLRLTLNIGIHLWNLRQDVMKNLSKREFHKVDKSLWDKTSQFCYERNKEKGYLDYPFVETC